MILNPKKMPEAEVSLRLAMYLVESGIATSDVQVALDGAHIKTGKTIHFPIQEFAYAVGLKKEFVGNGWKGQYQYKKFDNRIIVHTSPGKGDITTELKNGKQLYIESKKGTLLPSKSSSEYPLIREAIGQLVTVPDHSEETVIAVAIPNTEKFDSLVQKWKVAPLVKKLNLGFFLVGRDGTIKTTLEL